MAPLQTVKDGAWLDIGTSGLYADLPSTHSSIHVLVVQRFVEVHCVLVQSYIMYVLYTYSMLFTRIFIRVTI